MGNSINNNLSNLTTRVETKSKAQAPKPEVKPTAIATVDTLETGPGRAAASQVAGKGAPKVPAEVVKGAVAAVKPSWWGKLKAAYKAHFLVAGSVAVVSKGADLYRGKINLKQLAGGAPAATVADAVANVAIVSGVVGAAFAGPILAPICAGVFLAGCAYQAFAWFRGK